MAGYKVEIMETLRHVVEVEAGSQKMAEQMVDDRWKDGEYILDAGNFAGWQYCTLELGFPFEVSQAIWIVQSYGGALGRRVF